MNKLRRGKCNKVKDLFPFYSIDIVVKDDEDIDIVVKGRRGYVMMSSRTTNEHYDNFNVNEPYHFMPITCVLISKWNMYLCWKKCIYVGKSEYTGVKLDFLSCLPYSQLFPCKHVLTVNSPSKLNRQSSQQLQFKFFPTSRWLKFNSSKSSSAYLGTYPSENPLLKPTLRLS